MTDDRPSDLLSALPRSRPHRRSEKRPPRSAASDPEPRQASASAKSAHRPAKATRGEAKSSPRLAQPAQPRGVPGGTGGPRPEPSIEFPVLRTALQAATELTEIGVTLSAKALKRALGRLPRP